MVAKGYEWSGASAKLQGGAEMKQRLGIALALIVAIVTPSGIWNAPASATVGDDVLILASTVVGGAASIEATEVIAKGLNPVLVDDASFSAMTSTQFASYRAIVVGDTGGGGCRVPAAEANLSAWTSVINGNVLLIGTDPVDHASQGGETLVRRGIDFVIDQPDKTGFYFTMSDGCDGLPSGSSVPILEGLRPGGFTITGQLNCYNQAHIVATHPALTGLTDASLSNWSCSVHEAFDTWPGDFAVLAIAKDFNQTFTASDGTVGAPYILASGTGLKSFPLSLSPLSATAVVGSSHTVTAELLDGATAQPVPGAKIVFAIPAGPNSSATGTCSPSSCLTDADGRVSWTYVGTGGTGSDTIRAAYDVNGNEAADIGEPQTTAGVTWEAAVFDCKELLLYFARGSGQWDGVDRSEPWNGSPERNTFFSEVRRRLSSTGRSWTIEEHDAGQTFYAGSRYPAYSPSTWPGAFWIYFSPVDRDLYEDSVNHGVNEVLNYLNDRAASCPQEQWIIGGYSQGAHMLGNVFSNSAFSKAAKAHIRFAAFFGDPKLSLNGRGNRFTAPACRGQQFVWVRGNVACNADGGSLGQRVPYLPRELVNSVGSWCDRNDAVCAGEEFLTGPQPHASYPKFWIPQAGSEAVPHLLP